jgi:zinc transport system ATP-binding protein
VININNLDFYYSTDKSLVLKNVSMHVDKGSYISILGDNGSGKSTLVKLILGLIKPCSGTINIYTDRIGYVPQRVEGFNSQFPITVSELLDCHRKVKHIKDKGAIQKSLSQVNMESFKSSLIGNLSGGQMQRIFIARALMGNPELLILDEPSTGIDIENQREIYKIIKNLNSTYGITVLSVEHNLEAALTNSTHIFAMKKNSCKMYDIKDYIYINGSVSICHHGGEE